MSFKDDAQLYAREQQFGYLEGESDVLVISFAGLEGRPHFQFYGTLKALGYNALFLSDQKKAWYNTGLACFGDGVEYTLYILNHLTNYFDPDKIFLIGGSMGGHGALLFASLLGKGHVLALSPQVLLKPHYAWYPENEGDARYTDLSQLSFENNTLTVISSEFPLDVLSLSRIANVRCREGTFLVVAQQHNLAKVLKAKGLLAQFIAHWIRHREVAFFEPVADGRLGAPYSEALEALLDASYQAKWKDALPAADLFSLSQRNSHYLDCQIALTYFFNGRFEESLKFAEMSTVKAPQYINAYVYYVANLAAMGVWHKALSFYDECVWLQVESGQPKDAFLVSCADALGKLRKRRAAIRVREHVREIGGNPGLQRGNTFQLGRLHFEVGALKKSREVFNALMDEGIDDWMSQRAAEFYLPELAAALAAASA
ncbi:Uncharacterised protein [Bordetella ansorpii]|uniref:Uncharacterized protein n=1 Tax=Bordetella ansorpii TaxID=288768 RepID=A0A157SWJ8_9BORD|nr:hypothetical protein [Bordetella ansorpii]SAI74840.1 Uncharacterised protein [Bordetella ansorpii]